MVKKILILVLTIALKINAQVNLVPNPSFESYTACPTGSGEINVLDQWFSCGGSPDYFNTCAIGSSTPPSGIPLNWTGYQTALHGQAYIGLITKYSPNAREYVGTTLTQTLNIGTKYYVSAYINSKDSNNLNAGQECYSNRFGFRLTKTQFSYTNNPVPTNYSQVYSNLIITDTMNWVKISGSFVADSNYKYIMIGNFFDDANTSVTSCGQAFSLAYYLVDRVCLSTDSAFCNTIQAISTNSPVQKYKVYPNPFSDYISIEVGDYAPELNVILTDITGRILLSEPIYSRHHIINTIEFSQGIYFLKLHNKDRSIHYKLIK